MDKQQKLEFITDIMLTVRDKIVKDIDKYPDNWDGIELRYLIRDHFSRIVWGDKLDKRNSRYKRYDNFMISNGLY